MSESLTSDISLSFNKKDNVEMYTSPKAIVTADAVVAAMAPPAMLPTPGMSLNKLETILLPISVAPPAVMVDETNVMKKAFFNSKPNTPVILANIPI